MILYSWVKIIHILSACLLFGTGLGTALVMYIAHRTRDVEIMSHAYTKVVWADWFFTSTSGIIQLVTGLVMVLYIKLPFTAFWIWGSLVGYFVAGICWLPVVFLQIKLRDITTFAWRNTIAPKSNYNIYFYTWFVLGWPAFIALLGVFYLMVARPMTLKIFF